MHATKSADQLGALFLCQLGPVFLHDFDSHIPADAAERSVNKPLRVHAHCRSGAHLESMPSVMLSSSAFMSANTSRSDFALALFELLLLLLLELSLLAPGIVSLLSLPLFLPFFCALTAFSLALPFAAAALEELLLASVISASSSQDEPNLSFCCCLAAVRDSGAGASAACKQRHPHFAISAFRRPRQPPWLSSSPHQSWLWLAHR